ncbi:substrate-binding domain-containing protein [Streptomyces rubiginosohelvolus]|uniref:substrate-binding domain-containing protein n=1 Tax=Streptomyces rubiginosohelvolus TaxID=67362 RepID=UPI0035D986F7
MPPYNARAPQNRAKTHRAVLIGVDSYTHEPDLPAVAHSLRLIEEALTAEGTGVLDPGELFILPGPTGSSPGTVDPLEALREIRNAREQVDGLLVVYFAGHGLVRADGTDLHLLFSPSRVIADPHHPFVDALSWRDQVMAELRLARADWVVVVLDCCFAGNARLDFHPEEQQNFALLMAAEQGVEIPPGDAATGTDFTVGLHRLLTGRTWASKPATFTRLVGEIREAMAPLKAVHDHRWIPGERRHGDDVLLAIPGRKHGRESEGNGPAGTAHEAGGRSKRAATGREGAGGAPAQQGESETGSEAEARSSGAAQAAGGTHTAGTPQAVAPAPDRRPSSRRHRALCAALALVCFGGAGVLLSVGDDQDRGCAPPLELRVLVDPDIRPTVQKAADVYLDRDTGDCRAVGISVYTGNSTDVVDAFQAAPLWQAPPASCPPSGDCLLPQRDLGAQPDVWIPAASITSLRVLAEQSAAAGTAAKLDSLGSVAYTPMVLAVPAEAGRKPDPADRPAPLADLVAGVRDGGADGTEPYQVLRPDPEGGDGALLSTTALYGTDDRRPTDVEAVLTDDRLPPQPTARDLMCGLADGSRNELEDRAAVLIPEQTMALFNLPSASGEAGAVGRPACATDVLEHRAARYPTDVPVLDLPFFRVTWSGADRDAAAREQAVRDFYDWLAEDPEARAVFVRDGFRTGPSGKPSLPAAASPLTAKANEGAVSLLLPPSNPPTSASEVTETLRDYRQALGPGRVLYLLDDSTSMEDNRVWSGPGRAKDLVARSTASIGPDDTFGVWGLSPGDAANHTEPVPFGRPDPDPGPAREAIGRAPAVNKNARVLDGLRDGLSELRSGQEGPVPRLLVLVTDDEDSADLRGEDVRALVETATGGPPVRVVTVSLRGGGCAPGLLNHRLAEATGGRCLDAADDLATELTAEVAKTGTGDAR